MNANDDENKLEWAIHRLITPGMHLKILTDGRPRFIKKKTKIAGSQEAGNSNINPGGQSKINYIIKGIALTTREGRSLCVKYKQTSGLEVLL